jgi:MYXO-CTERM domain-containing protein
MPVFLGINDIGICVAGCVDADGDGHCAGEDCDDNDTSTHPGAAERCGDGKDNNCNGTVDDGCPGVDCKDGDGDGWPVGKDCKVADCDDADPKVHPFAEEVCGDGKDQSCNGSNDEGCTGVACEDKDGDGWPVGKACGAKQDCDDADGGASPWRPELCADGKDQDCSGAIDEGCPLCEDKDADGHGIGPQCTSWDCDDNDAKTYPGAKELCDKKDNSCDGTADEACEGGEGGGCGCGLGAGAGGGAALAWGLLVLLVLGARRRRR